MIDLKDQKNYFEFREELKKDVRKAKSLGFNADFSEEEVEELFTIYNCCLKDVIENNVYRKLVVLSKSLAEPERPETSPVKVLDRYTAAGNPKKGVEEVIEGIANGLSKREDWREVFEALDFLDGGEGNKTFKGGYILFRKIKAYLKYPKRSLREYLRDYAIEVAKASRDRPLWIFLIYTPTFLYLVSNNIATTQDFALGTFVSGATIVGAYAWYLLKRDRRKVEKEQGKLANPSEDLKALVKENGVATAFGDAYIAIGGAVDPYFNLNPTEILRRLVQSGARTVDYWEEPSPSGPLSYLTRAAAATTAGIVILGILSYAGIKTARKWINASLNSKKEVIKEYVKDSLVKRAFKS